MRIAAILLIVLLASCAKPATLQEQRDAAHQLQFIDDVIAENLALRSINNELRLKVQDLSLNQTRDKYYVNACLESCPYINKTADVPSPATRVPISDIMFQNGRVILDIPDVQYGIVSASKSMDPFLDEHTVVLEIPPKSSADIAVGDILIYELDGIRIIHRVIAVSFDDNGWYASVRGDNNREADGIKVRFEQVRGVVVGVIY